jgi:hypothetical protein
MSIKLVEEDRHAVDLLLDQGQSAMLQSGGPGYAASSLAVTERVQRVERVLSLLEALPADEPPAGLAGRTLQRLQEQTGVDIPAPKAAGHYADPSRPLA